MVTAYQFEFAFPDDHFVTDFIKWASTCTDASWEFHEAVALSILSAAVPDVRARLKPYPSGLPTNLYMALIGQSSTTRKSTAMKLGADCSKKADPNALMPERMTPEGFIDQLAKRSPGSSLLVIDEFGKFLEELHHREHLTGMQGLLLEAYAGNDYTYTKSKKKGQPDDIEIKSPHLNILGGTTELIFNKLHRSDVESGLLPRFVIVMPDDKPSRKPFYELGDNGAASFTQNKLIRTLGQLRTSIGPTPRGINFTDDCLRVLDAKFEQLERPGMSLMVARLNVTALKVAMLCAIGRPFTLGMKPNEWEVTADDARCALLVVERWERYALQFDQLLGENEVERYVKKVLELFRHLNSMRPPEKQRTPMEVRRRTVSRYLHVTAKQMKEVEEILLDRGVIEIKLDAARRRDSSIWVWEGQDGESQVA